MQLTSLDYKYLEPLALESYVQLTTTVMGSLVAESSIGRKFFVELLFEDAPASLLEAEKKRKKKKANPKEVKQIVNETKSAAEEAGAEPADFQPLDDFFGRLEAEVKYGNTSQPSTTVLKQQDKNKETSNTDEAKKEAGFFLRMWQRFKSFFSKDSKLRKFFSKCTNIIKRHWKIASIAFAIVVVAAVVVLLKRQGRFNKDFIRSIGNFLKKVIMWPYEKVRFGVTWIINKIKGVLGKKGVVESAITPDLTPLEFFYMAEVAVMEAEVENEPILKRIWDFIAKWSKKVGWDVPKNIVKNVVTKQYRKYKTTEIDNLAKVFKKDMESYKVQLKEAKKTLRQLEKQGAPLDAIRRAESRIKDIERTMENGQNLIKTSKRIKVATVIFIAVTLAAMVAIVIYVVKKYKQKKAAK